MSKGNPRKTTGRGQPAAHSTYGAEEGSVAWGGNAADGPRALQFTVLNWALLGSAALLLIAGYVALASSSPALSTVVAPILLVGAYVVLIPLGLIL